MPEGVVYVGRPTRFGNPMPIDGFPTREAALTFYRHYLETTPTGRRIADEARTELRGKDLACWCPIGQPCHADVLLELANA